MKYKVFSCVVLFLVLLTTKQAYSFDPSDDVSGAADYLPIQRYPLSMIELYTPKTVVRDHFIGLGRLKIINGQMVPEYSTRLSGSLTRLTYRGPDGHSSKELFEHFKNQVKPYVQELLYECEGRDCGSSNHWANNIFNIAILYGPDQYQYYLVAKLIIDGKDTLAMIYAIRRGNKRIYLQMDMLEISASALNSIEVNPDTVFRLLKEKGRYVLRTLEFNNENQLTSESSESLSHVVRMLEKQVRLNLYVVGHSYGAASLENLQQLSLQRAQEVVKALKDAGVADNRLMAIGVGPVAPNGEALGRQGRVELVINDNP